MTFYLSMTPLQEPFDLGLDDDGRQLIAFNVATVKTPSTTFAAELVKLLVTASVGVFGTNIFVGSAASIPAGDGPFLLIRDTGGSKAQWTHNSPTPAYVRPGAKIVARARTYAAAMTMARAAYGALTIHNTTVTP